MAFPPPGGGVPNPEIKPVSLVSPALADGFFTTEPPEKPYAYLTTTKKKKKKKFKVDHKKGLSKC